MPPLLIEQSVCSFLYPFNWTDCFKNQLSQILLSIMSYNDQIQSSIMNCYFFLGLFLLIVSWALIASFFIFINSICITDVALYHTSGVAQIDEAPLQGPTDNIRKNASGGPLGPKIARGPPHHGVYGGVRYTTKSQQLESNYFVSLIIGILARRWLHQRHLSGVYSLLQSTTDSAIDM